MSGDAYVKLGIGIIATAAIVFVAVLILLIIMYKKSKNDGL